MRVSVESVASTSAPLGGVPVAVAVFAKCPASTSTWVNVYVAVQVVDSPGARVVAGQCHRPYGRVIDSHRIQRHVPGVGHHEAVVDRGTRGVPRRRPGLLVQGDRRTGGIRVSVESVASTCRTSGRGARGRGGVREVPGIHIDLGQRVRRGTGRRLTRSQAGGRTGHGADLRVVHSHRIQRHVPGVGHQERVGDRGPRGVAARGAGLLGQRDRRTRGRSGCRWSRSACTSAPWGAVPWHGGGVREVPGIDVDLGQGVGRGTGRRRRRRQAPSPGSRPSRRPGRRRRPESRVTFPVLVTTKL